MTLQLKWVTQAQFAGYYVAAAKGFYEAEGLNVGDQQPYSGKLLNATMNRHAEAEGRPYLGIEIRQDQIADARGQAEWAERLHRICNLVAVKLS